MGRHWRGRNCFRFRRCGEVQARREPARFRRRHPRQCGHRCRYRSGEGLTGAPDQDVVSAATGAGRVLVFLDVGLGDIRACPPGSYAGIVVLRVPGQSAATVAKTISDLASLTELASLAGPVAVLQRGLLRIRHP